MKQTQSLGDLSIEELAVIADRTVREFRAVAILGIMILGGLTPTSPVHPQIEASPVKNKKLDLEPEPDPGSVPDWELREIAHGSF